MNKQVLERNFSRFAASYDDYADIQKRVAAELLAQIPNQGFASILEIGCGTGNYSLLLRKRFARAKISAFDLSEEMVEYAKDKHREEGINFFQADAERLDLRNKFDLVTSNACLHWVSDLEKVISLSKSLLNKGGRAAFSIFGPLTFNELGESLAAVLNNETIEAKNFPDQVKIGQIMHKYFKTASIKEITLHKEYQSLEELLYRIKLTGTNGSGLAQKSRFSRGLLKQIEAAYLEKFKSIIAAYQVFFCQAEFD
ncbi:MAG: malonyl-ACP O-methyltransferase BioC [Candidatus Omnitrophica bacterium]|nr:malonyl-ACP O-methyltransferase BioC [Candidatus Omnitrophota bacterium]MDD5653913.1 malonyl-ACP O-methyltransferase BioC [Candidatus Omnitrophota bacterium]